MVLSQFEGTANSSNMYLTAAAQNLLCMKIAASMGLTITAAWVTWFKVGGDNGSYKRHMHRTRWVVRRSGLRLPR